MESVDMQGLAYTYDAPALHEDFPNLDIFDRDAHWGADTVTMSFLLSGEDGEEKSVYRARQVLLQGEELLAPPQHAAQEPAFVINPGLNDAWLDKTTPGQGFLIVVFPDAGVVFLAWFTYDAERPAQNTALLGESGHRWLTAQGPYAGDTALLDVFLTQGGVFDAPAPAPGKAAKVGTIKLVWKDCETATLTYDIDPPGVQGEIDIGRIVPDNVGLCQALAGAQAAR